MPAPQKRIRKAVFPVAGLGTRFLPATKAMPKEMLTVVDRPVIQHVVDEARAAGIEHFIFVTGRNKGVDRGPFRQPVRARARRLAERGKTKELDELAKRPARRRRDELHAPAGAARPRPRGLVRARHRRRRAVRAAAARHAASRRQGLPGGDDRGLQRARRQPHRRLAGARRQTHQYGIVGVEEPRGQGFAHHADGREAASRAPRRPTCTSPAATSCSRRSSISSPRRSAAPAAKSSSPTR